MKEKKVEKQGQSSRTLRLDEDLLWGTHPVFEALQQEDRSDGSLV